jgi:DNA-binding NtrC family response regulator
MPLSAPRALQDAALQSPRKLLLVDDELEAIEGLAELLREEGFEVEVTGSAEEALQLFSSTTYNLVVTDLVLPGQTGVELTRALHAASPATVIVLLTGHATVKTAVAALKEGASDYLTKPIAPRKLVERARALLENRPDYLPNRLLKEDDSAGVQFEGMLARSRVMRDVFERVRLAAQSDATVLITGESGTGKELVAQAIHRCSRRAAGPFVAVHTGALSRELIASELFGHERGSFTGAVDRKEGKFELAEGGTIFLDEVSTMDERTQVNLLRVLESFSYARLGGKRERRADVRVVAATNRDLHGMVAEGLFREDLLYRLNIVQLTLPPLRERRDDLALLASSFMASFAERYHKRMIFIPAETQRLLEGYRWPGNVRELRNVIEQAVLLGSGTTLDPELLPQMIYRQGPPADFIRLPLGCSMGEAEREVILRTLDAQQGNKKATAEVLGISRRSLYNRLAEYGERTEDE